VLASFSRGAAGQERRGYSVDTFKFVSIAEDKLIYLVYQEKGCIIFKTVQAILVTEVSSGLAWLGLGVVWHVN
jgi:hypothetical protein